MKALALSGGSAAVASSSLAPAQVLLQRAAPPAIIGNVLVDAFATDRHLSVAGNLVGTPVFAKAILHLQHVASPMRGRLLAACRRWTLDRCAERDS